MQEQLPLRSPRAADWYLDHRTRELGRRGVAEARQALRAAAQRDVVRQARRAAAA
jgi:hypothetical protein